MAAGTIRVRESWDRLEGSIAPKTRTSKRTTPMPGVLRDLLLDRRQRGGGVADGALVFADRDDAAIPRREPLPSCRPRLGKGLAWPTACASIKHATPTPRS